MNSARTEVITECEVFFTSNPCSCSWGNSYGCTVADNTAFEIIGWLLVAIGAAMVDVTRYVFRGAIAKKYNIKFGCCPDYAMVCCCPNCSLIQEAKVVKSPPGQAMQAQVVSVTPVVAIGAPVTVEAK